MSREYGPRDAARYIAVHPSTVRRWVREGKMKARKDGHTWQISRAEIDRIVGRETIPFGPPPANGEPRHNYARSIRRSREERGRELRNAIARF